MSPQQWKNSSEEQPNYPVSKKLGTVMSSSNPNYSGGTEEIPAKIDEINNQQQVIVSQLSTVINTSKATV